MKIHPKNYKVMFGLVALLFVLAFAQIGATLKLFDFVSSSQVAQVKPIAQESKETSSCFQITPAYNRIGSIEGDMNIHETNYFMYMNVKNACAYSINIIDTHWWNSPTTLVVSKIERMGPQGVPLPLDVLNNPFGVGAVLESIVCNDCNGGIQSYYPSPTGLFNNNGIMSVSSYKILPGETKSVSIQTNIEHLNNINEHFRAAPKQIKWFTDSALADNMVSVNEIFTQGFSVASANSIATDYTKLWIID